MIEALRNTQSGYAENRRKSAQTGGASFQDFLAETAAAQTAQPAASGKTRLTRDELLAALNDTKRTMVEQMKVGKKKKEEEDAWNKMMEYIDAWIDSLRGEGSVEKTARAYSDYMSRRASRPADKKDLGDFILEQLEKSLEE